MVNSLGIEPRHLAFQASTLPTELRVRLVNEERFELSRTNVRWFLRPECIPFHHSFIGEGRVDSNSRAAISDLLVFKTSLLNHLSIPSLVNAARFKLARAFAQGILSPLCLSVPSRADLAETPGFEPGEYRIQSPVPYRLATSQSTFLYVCCK